jgi:hypothetical protein
LRLREKTSVFFAFKTGQQFAEHTAGVTHQTYIDWESQADPFGIELNLNAFRIAGFG